MKAKIICGGLVVRNLIYSARSSSVMGFSHRRKQIQVRRKQVFNGSSPLPAYDTLLCTMATRFDVSYATRLRP